MLHIIEQFPRQPWLRQYESPTPCTYTLEEDVLGVCRGYSCRTPKSVIKDLLALLDTYQFTVVRLRQI